MRNAVIRVQLRSRSDLYLTLTAELVSLVPGSLCWRPAGSEGVVYLHVMDVRSEADLDRARRDVLDAEAAGAARLRLRCRGRRARAPEPDRGGAAMSAAAVIIVIGVVLLGVAAGLTLVRMARGPSTLDRVVAADVMIAVVIAGLAMEAI